MNTKSYKVTTPLDIDPSQVSHRVYGPHTVEEIDGQRVWDFTSDYGRSKFIRLYTARGAVSVNESATSAAY